jgi:hypothetical protein
VSEAATTISFTPQTLEQLGLGTRRLFDAAFIRVLVRRLHAAHEALAHPRRSLGTAAASCCFMVQSAAAAPTSPSDMQPEERR